MQNGILSVFFVAVLLIPKAYAVNTYIRAQGNPLQAQSQEWSVVFKPDLVSITDKKKKTDCKIHIDNVIGGFWIQKTTLIFESGNAVEDKLSFVDGTKCKILKGIDLEADDSLRKKHLQLLRLSDK